MYIVRSDAGESREGTTFSGVARLTPMIPAQKDQGMKLTMVEFIDGAVTNWHDHPGEQILYIVDGKGRVGDGDQEYEVFPGDAIHFGPGERHWHGAAEGHNMRHLSITNIGSPNWHDDNPFA